MSDQTGYDDLLSSLARTGEDEDRRQPHQPQQQTTSAPPVTTSSYGAEPTGTFTHSHSLRHSTPVPHIAASASPLSPVAAAASPRNASFSPSHSGGHGGHFSPSSAYQSAQAGPLPAPAAGIQTFVEFGMEESDVDFVQSRLDYHWSQCKEEVMSRMHIRQRRVEDEARRLEAFRASYVTHVNALQADIEQLKEENMSKGRDIERMRGQQNNMVAAWTIQHDNVDKKRMQVKVWNQWRRQFLDEQHLKHLSAKFVHPHYRRRLLLQVVSSWRSNARTSKRVADEAYWRGQIQDTTANLIQDYEKNLSELRHQLAQAEDVIRYHHEDQTAMEEKLKNAFIRGVCALNREALSVFTAPGDVAEANIRSHFSAAPGAVGQGAFMAAAATAIAQNNATGGTGVPPPATNPSAFPAAATNPAAGGARASSVSPPPPSSMSGTTGGPSAPLPSSFVGSARHAPPVAQQQQSSSVGRGHQLPYPPHSHAPPMQHQHGLQSQSARAAPSHHAHPLPHSHPHPHPHPHPYPHSQPQGRPVLGVAGAQGLHGMPQPRQQGPPRPYGK